MLLRILVSMSMAVLATACGPSEKADAPVDLAETAREIARTSIITDGHIDVPYRLNKEWVDVSFATEDGDFDYPRAVEGGLNFASVSASRVPSRSAWKSSFSVRSPR